MDFPRAKPGLLSHELDKQVVVYDPDGDRVHLLDATTAGVLKSMQGGNSADAKPTSELFESAGDLKGEMYAIAVDELTRADLIQNSGELLPDVTRRELLRKIAMVGAGALLVPAVVSLTPGSMFAQTVCDSRINNGSSMCVAGTPCCAPLVCKNDNMCYVATGGPCTADNQCLNGMCVSNVCN